MVPRRGLRGLTEPVGAMKTPEIYSQDDTANCTDNQENSPSLSPQSSRLDHSNSHHVRPRLRSHSTLCDESVEGQFQTKRGE